MSLGIPRHLTNPATCPWEFPGTSPTPSHPTLGIPRVHISHNNPILICRYRSVPTNPQLVLIPTSSQPPTPSHQPFRSERFTFHSIFQYHVPPESRGYLTSPILPTESIGRSSANNQPSHMCPGNSQGTSPTPSHRPPDLEGGCYLS